MKRKKQPINEISGFISGAGADNLFFDGLEQENPKIVGQDRSQGNCKGSGYSKCEEPIDMEAGVSSMEAGAMTQDETSAEDNDLDLLDEVKTAIIALCKDYTIDNYAIEGIMSALSKIELAIRGVGNQPTTGAMPTQGSMSLSVESKRAKKTLNERRGRTLYKKHIKLIDYFLKQGYDADEIIDMVQDKAIKDGSVYENMESDIQRYVDDAQMKQRYGVSENKKLAKKILKEMPTHAEMFKASGAKGRGIIDKRTGEKQLSNDLYKECMQLVQSEYSKIFDDWTVEANREPYFEANGFVLRIAIMKGSNLPFNLYSPQLRRPGETSDYGSFATAKEAVLELIKVASEERSAWESKSRNSENKKLAKKMLKEKRYDDYNYDEPRGSDRDDGGDEPDLRKAALEEPDIYGPEAKMGKFADVAVDETGDEDKFSPLERAYKLLDILEKSGKLHYSKVNLERESLDAISASLQEQDDTDFDLAPAELGDDAYDIAYQALTKKINKYNNILRR